MKNFIKQLGLICAVLLLSSFGNSSTDAVIKEARERIAKDKAKCIVIKDDTIVADYVGNGVAPLLEVYRKNPEAMKGGVIVDKVIGRAAAFIIINGGASRAYGLLVSESAKSLLEEHNIKLEYDKIVPEILNRDLSGLCPLESSVLGENDPAIALDKILAQIEILMSGKANNVTENKMSYRTAKNGERVSLLGYGGIFWPMLPAPADDGNILDQNRVNELIDHAIESGVNYFDTSIIYARGWSEPTMGEALSRHPRESYYVATKISNLARSNWSEEKSKAMYQNSFKNLQVDYIDFFVLHGVGMPLGDNSSQEVFSARFIDNGMLDFLLEERKAGRIRNLGFSYHGDTEVFERLMSLHDKVQWDFAQMILNYVDWEYSAQRPVPAFGGGLATNTDPKYLYSELTKREIPIIAMQAITRGELASPPSEIEAKMRETEPNMTPASWAFRYAASLPNVLTVLSGMKEMEHLQENISTFSPLKPLSDDELEMLKESATIIANQQ